MLILGLDIATTTGFAWYDTNASLSVIKTGTIKAVGENAEEKAASLALQLRELFYETVMVDGRSERRLFKPEFVAIERPLPNIMQFDKVSDDLVDGQVTSSTVNPNQMLLPTYIGAAVAIIAAYRIPFETIAPQSWHKAYYGSGFKPPKKMMKDKNGHPKRDRRGNIIYKNDWKTPAVERARELRIAVKTADAAEAIGIAFAGKSCDKFRKMEHDRMMQARRTAA